MYLTSFANQRKWEAVPKLLLEKKSIAIFVILLFHISGFIGVGFTAYTSWFLHYTPLNLLVALAAIIWAHEGKNKAFWHYLLICSAAGWLIEFVGVSTKLPFGNYQYHGSLGFEIAGVPLMTGVIWWLTCFGASAIANEMVDSCYSRILFAALLMVIFDIPVEHLASKMGMWSWEIGYAPFQNYLGWLLYGIALQYILQSMPVQKKSVVAIIYFVVAFLFFLCLDVLNWS
jgi:uncharacterized membrane protein